MKLVMVTKIARKLRKIGKHYTVLYALLRIDILRYSIALTSSQYHLELKNRPLSQPRSRLNPFPTLLPG